MKNTRGRHGVVASRGALTIVAVLIATIVSGCTATAAPMALSTTVPVGAGIVPTTGSAHPLFLVGDEYGEELPAGTVRGWDQNVLGSPVVSDPSGTHSFAVPAGATAVATFISPRGQETNLKAWDAYGQLELIPAGVQMPNLKLSANTEAGSGSPSGTAAVAKTGGDYSLGIAFLNSSNQVVEADFTFITVVPDDTAAKATWTWAVPAS
ncbi:hypothetical protein ABCS02_08560 [Microbacterium sp. X-17]|uniref:hypothetical protein n=1 Tax=Microbacterium sp. X-17 TaxID=3144404 RepID=UPI0031F48188